MSKISLTLVVHFKSSKNLNDMAKLAIKNEKITAFGGINSTCTVEMFCGC